VVSSCPSMAKNASVSAIPEPVTLAVLKADPEFSESPLVRQGRLSVVPLTAKQAAMIEKLGGGR
ncbi:MAG TPA: EVE domain-containing protein, partial [Vicinamibacteria bacterium]|nr:EVE domain-containing protein [Vicinamibacteria bacterium]